MFTYTTANRFATRSYRANKTFVAMILSIAATAGLLIGGCSEAHAATPKHTSKHATPATRMAESVTVCTQRDMLQGKVGEKVWTCETIAYKHATRIAKR